MNSTLTFREGRKIRLGRRYGMREVFEVGKHIVATVDGLTSCGIGCTKGYGSNDTGKVSQGLFTWWALGNGQRGPNRTIRLVWIQEGNSGHRWLGGDE